MEEKPDLKALLDQMRTLSAGDISTLEASLQEPDSLMATSPGSANDRLWSAMEALGWMHRHEDSIPLPSGSPLKILAFGILPEGRKPISELLSELRNEKL